jgi:hypothetical protein
MRFRGLFLLLPLLLAMSGCSEPTTSTSVVPTQVAGTIPPNRPATPVKITVLSPTPNEVIHGATVHVVLSVSGGTVVQATSSKVVPTEGHAHLYLDGQLIYMAYTLQQDVPVQPGTSGHEYQMYAEFVGSDHFPFSPRDTTTPFYFTVEP